MTESANWGLSSLAERIDAVEEAYEFCLAYAAQGRRGAEGGARSEIRRVPERALMAGEPAMQAFLEVLRGDVAKAAAAIRLVLAQRTISSQLIDNLNASIHLRALLTDLFLIDESLKGAPAPQRDQD